MNWKKIAVNSNLIQHTTDKAVLIKQPETDFTFWHPKKLIKIKGKNGYLIDISYNDDFTFEFFRTSTKTYERLEKKEVSANDFAQEMHAIVA